MSDADLRKTGRCACGAVELAFTLKNMNVDACHCGICRKWSGGILLALEVAGAIETAETDALGLYASSDWAERGFCRQCGSSLFWRLKDGGHAIVSAQCIDGLDVPKLTTEIFIDEKPAYYSFAEETEKMTGADVFAKFAPKAE